MTRHKELLIWLKQFFEDGISLNPVSNDASFRGYYRISSNKGTFIVMDAPPDKENISSFVVIGKNLHKDGIRVPLIYETNPEQGFILMEDFGNKTYSSIFSFQNPTLLYKNVLQALFKIQKNCIYKNIPMYTATLLRDEMSLFEIWYLKKYKKIKLSSNEINDLNKIFNMIITSNLKQSQCVVHRDFHCRNLMYLDKENTPGIIDFQDAVNGPITYDLVSLLKDAYFEFEEDVILDMVIRYWEMLREANLIEKIEFVDFFKSFEFMGVQRHLKILGIFVRLSLRDNKQQYLDNLPLVEKYLIKTTSRYKELFPLRNILNKVIKNDN